MDLTANALTRVLAVCCGNEPEGPQEAVLMVRQQQPAFAPTLYAAWRNEGSPLNPALRYELDTQTARTRRYREIAAELAAVVPDLASVKGLEVADHYPADSTRYMNDLDCVARDEALLWTTVEHLVRRRGWTVNSATFSVFDGDLHLLVCLRLPHEDPYCLPYGVEITTYVALGDLGGVAPVIQLPPPWRNSRVKNLMMLLFERFEQGYRARDLVDAALMLSALQDHSALWREIERIGLWPEYTELADLLARTELIELPRTPGSRTGSLARSRARRAGRLLAGLRRPPEAAVRHLQQRFVLDRITRPEQALWAAAERRLSTERALRAGLLCFGLPVPDVQPDVTASQVHHRDGLTYVDTPIGRFLLTAGEDVEQDAVDLLAADARPEPAAPQPPEPTRPAQVDPAQVDPTPAEPVR